MSKLIDLTGQKFGRLTVLHKDTNRITKNGSYWICQCNCGKIKSIKSSSLRRGEIQSCGCLRNEKSIEAKKEKGLIDDLTGQRFGFLTVISKNPNRGSNRAVYWDCICDCGNRVTVQSSNLKRKDSSRTISCGCYHMSLGEKQIKDILDNSNIEYKQEYQVTELHNKRYDFALFKNNRIIRFIEFDGEQHFQDVNTWDSLETIQQRDKEKNEYALKHNIPLVRIPYWERDKITLDMILGEKYLVKE